MREIIPLFRVAAGAVSLLTIGGCGQPSGDPPADGGTGTVGAGETALVLDYDWYLEANTPAGRTTITEDTEGRLSNHSFVHWNNREWTLTSELELDADGFSRAQRLTGTGPFGSTIDERFSYAHGVASWQTPGEGGSVVSETPAIYLPNEDIALAARVALVRAAAVTADSSIALFPRGRARVSRVHTLEVALPSGPERLNLWAISGIGFTPSYLWLDDEMRLKAVSLGWLGMVPRGWSPGILETLAEAQRGEDARLIESLTGDLAHQLERDLVLANVDIVDVENGSLLATRHVHISKGKIAAVSETPLDVAEAITLDATGQTLIPGLWDMHGHFGLADGVLNIAGGVTSVRDVGSEHADIMELTERFASGEVIGPTTYRAGFMDRAGPFASGWAAASLEDALERVDFYARNGYRQVKLYSSIDPAWVESIAQRTHARGLRLSGHIPAFMSAEQAVRAGYDEIQHINMVFLNFLAGDREDTRKQLRFTLYGDEAGNLDLDSRDVRDFLALLAAEGVVVDPTAAIFETQLIHRSGQPDPTFAAVIDHLPLSIARPLYNPEMEMGEMADAWARSAVAQATMLRLLHENGIQLVAGSDHMPAFTLHRELEVYVEAGIPAADVLRIATLDSARILGVADRTGSVAIGKDADLVLLAGNPLEDISAVRNGTLVVKGERLYRPDQLYEAVGVVPFIESLDPESSDARMAQRAHRSW